MTTLGDVVQGLDSSEAENARLSTLIADSGSLQFAVLSRHHRGKYFSNLCKSKRLVKKFHGFRPTSEKYKKLAFDDVMNEFRNKSASKMYWDLYRLCVVEHLRAEAAELNILLSSVEVEKGQFTSTVEILESIASSALKFNVSPQQVEMLYELWHFERWEAFDNYLRRFPKPDLKEVVDTRINQLRDDVDGRLESLVSKLHQVDESCIRVASEVQALQAKCEVEYPNKLDAVTADMSSVSDALKLHEENQSKNLERVQLEHENITSKLEDMISSLAKSVARLAESGQNSPLETELASFRQSLSRLENDIEDLKVSVPAASEVGAASVKVIENTSRSKDFAVVIRQSTPSHGVGSENPRSLDSAVGIFNSCLATPDRGSAKAMVAFNTLLRMNCVVYPSRAGYMDWLKSVGWEEQVTTVCAGPNWVDQEVLSEHFSWLVDQHERVRSLVILDFDVGYVEGYLIPLLKVFLSSTVVSPWKKLALVPSGSDWCAPASLFHLVGVLPSLRRQLAFVEPGATSGLDVSSLTGHALFSGDLNDQFRTEMLESGPSSKSATDLGPQLSVQQKHVVYASHDSVEQAELFIEGLQKTLASRCNA